MVVGKKQLSSFERHLSSPARPIVSGNGELSQPQWGVLLSG